jgi:hypothetical protein
MSSVIALEPDIVDVIVVVVVVVVVVVLTGEEVEGGAI